MSSVSELQHLRAKPRLKLFQPTTMRVAGETIKIHLLDLSATGALAHAATPPTVGARVHVTCGPEARAARVVWAADKRFGIAFTVPLTAALIEETIASRRATVAIAAARIGPLVR